MHTETFVNIIKGLNKTDFDKVAMLLLNRVFQIKAINVDGRDDGGTDIRDFKSDGTSSTIAYQITVQNTRWKEKAIEDAQKAVNKLMATRYYFLTSRDHSNTDLRMLEDNIFDAVKIKATCLAAREIAGLLVEGRHIKTLLDILGVPQIGNLSSRPDKNEVLLSSYIVLSKDRKELSNSVYDDTLILTLRSNNERLAKPELLQKATEMLGDNHALESKLESRVDSLLSRGVLLSKSGDVWLAPETIEELEIAERAYLKDFDSLCQGLSDLIQRDLKIQWNDKDVMKISLLLSRAFIKEQLNLANNASMGLISLGITKSIGNPLQEIRDMLREKKVPTTNIEVTLKKMVELAKELPLVKRLARAALFVAIEGVNPFSKVKALGTSDWNHIKVFIDTSVAIPYLCSCLFRETEGQFSGISLHGVQTLLELGANAVIPYDYVVECAAHMMIALDYDKFDSFEGLEYSTNGFVSHYYQLKKNKEEIPSTFREYLSCFATSINTRLADKKLWRNKIVSELEPLLRKYGISYEPMKTHYSEKYSKDVEVEYISVLKKLNRKKAAILLNHDIKVLTHIRKLISEELDTCVCLTWDGTMIGVGKELSNCGWVISPKEIADIAGTMISIADSNLCSLAHSLARMHEKPKQIVAQIVDKIVTIVGEEKLQDWQFVKKVENFKNELLGQIDITQESFKDYVDKETDKFLEDEGIVITDDELKKLLE